MSKKIIARLTIGLCVLILIFGFLVLRYPNRLDPYRTLEENIDAKIVYFEEVNSGYTIYANVEGRVYLIYSDQHLASSLEKGAFIKVDLKQRLITRRKVLMAKLPVLIDG